MSSGIPALAPPPLHSTVSEVASMCCPRMNSNRFIRRRRAKVKGKGSSPALGPRRRDVHPELRPARCFAPPTRRCPPAHALEVRVATTATQWPFAFARSARCSGALRHNMSCFVDRSYLLTAVDGVYTCTVEKRRHRGGSSAPATR